VTDQSDDGATGPIEFSEGLRDDGERTFALWSITGRGSLNRLTSPDDIIVALQANAALRAKVLSALGLPPEQRLRDAITSELREKLRLAESELAEAKARDEALAARLLKQIDVSGELRGELSAERARVREMETRLEFCSVGAMTGHEGSPQQPATESFCEWAVPGGEEGEPEPCGNHLPCAKHPAEQVAPPPVEPKCWCQRCHPENRGLMRSVMILCPTCGNKRCPRATNHDFQCTHSNEPGQNGSSYGYPACAKCHRDGEGCHECDPCPGCFLCEMQPRAAEQAVAAGGEPAEPASPPAQGDSFQDRLLANGYEMLAVTREALKLYERIANALEMKNFNAALDRLGTDADVRQGQEVKK
jgi:hypothetical protein